MKTVRVLKLISLCLALTFLAGAIVIYPERYVTCCFQGFAMWAECVLPSLFPFMVITLILIKSGAADKASLPLKKVTGVFGLPPAAALCFVISLCSGYPAGTKCVAEFYESGCLSARDCKKLAALCSTSGPLFIIGSVGVKMFGDKSAGQIILLAHIISVLSVALFLSLILKRGDNTEYKRAVPQGNLLYDSFYGAVTAVAVAGGFIAFFSVTAQILYDFNILLPLEKLIALFTDEASASAVCRGLIEVTRGCRELAGTGSDLGVPFCGFLITFGGVSIILQQMGYLQKAKVSGAYFVAVKAVQGMLCFILLLLFGAI